MSVEAAASLFGSDDSAADPFASLGAEDSNTSTHHEDANSTNTQTGYPNETAYSQTGQQYDTQGNGQNSWSNGQYDYGTTGSNYYSQSQSGAGGESTQQGWYDEAGVWQNYQQHNVGTSPATSTVAAPAAPASNYNPYTPQNAQVVPSQPSTQQSYSPYDPYKPTTQAASNAYAPAQTAQSTYDPYKPSAPAAPVATPSAYATPSYNYPATTPSYSAPTPNLATVPTVPPPAPKAPLNRPKVSNAYDPPFPVSTKRAPASRGPSNPAYSAYNTYAAPAPPAPAPPPPAPRRSPPSSGMHGSAYPQGPSISETLARASQPHATMNGPSHYGPRPTPSEAPHPNESGSYAPYGNGAVDPYRPGAPNNQPSLNGVYAPPSNVQQSYAPPPKSYAPSTAPQNSYVPPNNGWPSQDYPPHQPDANNPQWSSGPAVGASNQYSPNQNYTSPVRSPQNQRLPQVASQEPRADTMAVPPSFADADEGLRRSPSPNNWSTNSLGGRSPHSSPPPANNQFSPRTGRNGSERSLSPASASGRSTGAYQPLANISPTNSFKQFTNGERTMSPALSELSIDPHASKEIPHGQGPYNTSPNLRHASPPVAAPNVTLTSPGSAYKPPPSQATNPYAPPPKPQFSRTDPSRSMSSDSLPSKPAFGGDIYAPHRQQSESFTSQYDYPASKGSELGPVQELLVPSHVRSQYAPSPSLVGSNDPLGRTTARVPVFSFGFGGKFITCFHNDPDLSTGFDVALSSRKSTAVQVRLLNKLIPESALDPSAATFPGPLFSDPGTPTAMSLVRTGNSAQMKAKKARVVKYLDERADELLRAIGYLHSGSQMSREAEGKLVLVNLLKVMVENDGKVSGTPQIDRAVRVALVRQIEDSASTQDSGLTLAAGFAAPADLGSSSELSVPFSHIGLIPPTPNEEPISVTTLRPAALDKIRDFLIRGERQKAYHFALDEKLWAHAMVISSSIDKEAWKEVVGEFLKSELGVKADPTQAFALGGEPSVKSNGREGLRVAYSLYSGQGAAAVQELVPQSLLARANAMPLSAPLSASLSTLPMATPMTANFIPAIPPTTAKIPEESLASWAETVAMIYSSPLSNEASLALTSLGDHLLANKWIEAAHVCYLLSPQTSPMGGVTNPAARLLLVGGVNPRDSPTFFRDPDTIIFTEIVEFALSLATPTKGQEPFSGLPYLQAFKLLRAASLAEVGHVQQASRYTEAISASRTRPSPYFTQTFEEQLKGLSDRIIAAPHLDKSGSWIGGKMAKPSMNNIGNWLEGRFTNFIAGDGDGSPTRSEDENKDADKTFSGPFAHYSSISNSGSPSPSPAPAMINTNAFPPPRRTESAMAYGSPASSYVHIDRASSVTDYSRQRQPPSSQPRVYSAAPNVTSFPQSSFGQKANGYAPQNGHSRNSSLTPSDSDGSTPGLDAPWWGSTYSEESSSQTPTASTFFKPGEPVTSSASSSSGLISLMDDRAYSVNPSPSPMSRERSNDFEDDEEDLGFGNSKPKPKKVDDGDDDGDTPKKESDTSAKKEPAAKPQERPAASSGSSSWFGSVTRLFKKGDGAPAPIKASLGEESQFYYDEVQKRWVNRNAPAEAAKPAAPPPPPSRVPSRAQTASPSRATGSMSPSAPPQRPSSAIDLTTSPPTKAPMRIRSNLVPNDSGPPTPLMSPGMAPNRPGSAAPRKNLRSRYVDVFQQESGAQ